MSRRQPKNNTHPCLLYWHNCCRESAKCSCPHRQTALPEGGRAVSPTSLETQAPDKQQTNPPTQKQRAPTTTTCKNLSWDGVVGSSRKRDRLLRSINEVACSHSGVFAGQVQRQALVSDLRLPGTKADDHLPGEQTISFSLRSILFHTESPKKAFQEPPPPPPPGSNKPPQKPNDVRFGSLFPHSQPNCTSFALSPKKAFQEPPDPFRLLVDPFPLEKVPDALDPFPLEEPRNRTETGPDASSGTPPPRPRKLQN